MQKLSKFNSLFLFGARSTGKSTLLRQLFGQEEAHRFFWTGKPLNIRLFSVFFAVIVFGSSVVFSAEKHLLKCETGPCTQLGCAPTKPCCNQCGSQWQYETKDLEGSVSAVGNLPECKVDGCGNGASKLRIEAMGDLELRGTEELMDGNGKPTGYKPKGYKVFVVKSYKVVN